MMNNKRKENKKNGFVPLIAFMAAFAILLFIRDFYEVNINKYIFVIISAIAVISLDIHKSICLLCYLMPLYVGLPGNYISLIFLGRFCLETLSMKFSIFSVLSIFAIALYIELQNWIYSYNTTAVTFFVPGLILVLLIFMLKSKDDYKHMFVSYTFGVAAMGLIMLLSTLKVYSFADFLTVTARLGTSNAMFTDSIEIMSVRVDPNYYGLFAIAALTATFPVLREFEDKKTKMAIVISFAVIIIVALCGLSRSFIVVLFAWLIFLVFENNKFVNFMKGAVVISILVTVVFVVFPDIVDALMERFNDDTMLTANGRTEIIEWYYTYWTIDAQRLFLGTGFFNCFVHCMPLQYLFGGGIVFFILMTMYAFSLIENKKNIISFGAIISVVLTFVMSCTVPIASLLHFMFPVVVSILSYNYLTGKNYEKKLIR